MELESKQSTPQQPSSLRQTSLNSLTVSFSQSRRVCEVNGGCVGVSITLFFLIFCPHSEREREWFRQKQDESLEPPDAAEGALWPPEHPSDNKTHCQREECSSETCSHSDSSGSEAVLPQLRPDFWGFVCHFYQ